MKNPAAIRDKEINLVDLFGPNDSETKYSQVCLHVRDALPRILQTLLGRTQKPLSLRRCSMVL